MPVATEPPLTRMTEPVRRWLSRLLVRLLAPVVEEAIVSGMRKGAEPFVALTPEEYEAYRETVEVLADADALDDLRLAEPDEQAQPYGEIRRELGLA